MKYTPTDVDGVTIVDLEPHRDDRGFVSRSFCAGEFAANGLTSPVVQTNISYNYTRGTLRGLHQDAEAKLVRCTRGAIVEVAVDVRPESPTYRKHVMVQLSAENRRMMYVPRGFAHGILTLEGDTEAFYLVSARRALERPALCDRLAGRAPLTSDKDARQCDFDPAWHLAG